ncbi:MAG TPA: sensor histidine kinase [Geminicoccus sp.]|uniref:sensor histidine kinase n=1 Tax=Geminicoccus sp. TaxID=2024832 RepID=UPI002E36B43F|nr:sensor histidine kinase [Geminicoccus sp.]HEX2525949.1 sensor histidine kinase [Geminicoccus sp.]
MANVQDLWPPISSLRGRGSFDALIGTYDLSLPGQVRPDLQELASRVSTMLGSEAVTVEPSPGVTLVPIQVMPLSMILHELGTNAIKHGALSSAGGRVRLGWTLNGEEDEQVLTLHWREEGGPVVQQPTSQGFGTRLINGAARDLRAPTRTTV